MGHADAIGGVLSALLLALESPERYLFWFCILRSCSIAGDDVPFIWVVTSAMEFSPNAEAQRAVLSNTSLPENVSRPRLGSRPKSEGVVEAPNEGAKRLFNRGSAFFGLRPRSTGDEGNMRVGPLKSKRVGESKGVEEVNGECPTTSSHTAVRGRRAGGLETLRLMLLVENELEVETEVRERDLREREEGGSRAEL